MSRKQKSSVWLKYFILISLLILYLFPFVLVLINSFKAKRDVIKNPLSLIGAEGFL